MLRDSEINESTAFREADDLRAYVPLQVVFVALTFVTGVLDATTYLDFGHVFAANMTGNFVLLGLGILGTENLSARTSLVAVAGFLIGVAAGGRLARWLEPRGQPWVVTSLSSALGASMLALLATVYRSELGDYPALVLLALAMGLINATANRIGIPGLNTTMVITTTLTNLVCGTQLSDIDARKRLRQISAVAAIFLGVLAGGALLLRFGAVTSIGTGVAVVLVGTVAYVLTSRRETAPPKNWSEPV